MRQGTLDDRYALVNPLGGGGMAVVFLAHDRVLTRNVALKVLRQEYAQDDEFVERFRREAISAAALSHPNIVPVYDRGETEDGRYYIAMEYVSGGTLKERIDRDGPLAPRVAVLVASQVAEALGVAHDRGIIHRDVKPRNILVSESGDVKVADFGIARAASASAISRTEDMLGTARYMSPEQAMGEPVGPASDLYSLGVVFYEMLTGRVPFDAELPVALAMKHVNEPPRPPKELNPEIPERINALVLTATRTMVDPVLTSGHETILKGSQSQGAGRRRWWSGPPGSRKDLRRLDADHQALAQTPPREWGRGAEADPRTSPPEGVGAPRVVALPVANQQRPDPPRVSRGFRGADGRVGLGRHSRSGHRSSTWRVADQKKSRVASERDEQKRGLWSYGGGLRGTSMREGSCSSTRVGSTLP